MNPDALTPDPLDRSAPLRDWFTEPEQWRAKVQRYSKAPPELTVQRVSFQRQADAYHRAWENGASSCMPRRASRTPTDIRDPEDIERARRRAKTRVRKLVTELAPNHMVTFTTRETGPHYFTREDWRQIWARFIRMLNDAGLAFEYVGVLEPHPSNPAHLHMHVAWRGRIQYKFLRRCWHIAICAHRGVKVTKTLSGADAPGNIQDRPVKAPQGSNHQIFKIAKYIAKYITKDLVSEFNKKRYWTSKGLTVTEAQAFWLSEVDQLDAIREAGRVLGFWSSDGELLATTLMVVHGRVAWARLDPDRPPF
jgi:hypothetical protein